MKLAIGALVRGYENLNDYKTLILRNEAIHKKINSKVDTPFDMIVFHEGNISNNHQKYIKENSPEDINFIDVNQDFKFEDKLISKAVDYERFDSGYRLMCKFNACGIWKYLNEYEYFMRVDEDVSIKKFDTSIFTKPKFLDRNFYTIKLSKESHEPTNQTLPIYLSDLFTTQQENFYDHKFPYTNFYLTDINIFRDQSIQNVLTLLETNDDQFIYRWGDLPIIGSLLNYFSYDIKILKNAKYLHMSHDTNISSRKFFKF